MRINRLIMGTGVSIDIPGAEPDIFEAAFGRLTEIDNRFSTYKAASEVSRFIRGEIAENNLSQELKKVIIACREAEATTNGYFSAWVNGVFEPSGYVKGWAINEAAKTIEAAGYKTFCIGIGGDILSASDSEKVWNIGIQSPSERMKVIAKLRLRNGAVATSGNYERGPHITNPKTGKPADSILAISVTGRNIIKADVLATAGFVMGRPGLEFIEKQAGYEALMIDKSSRISMTSGMQRLIA